MKFLNIPIYLCCGTIEESYKHDIADVWFDAKKRLLWATDGRMAIVIKVRDVQSFETSGPIPPGVFRALVSHLPLGVLVEILAVRGRVDFPGMTKIKSMERIQSIDRPQPPFEQFIPPAKREEVVLGLNARLLYRLARALPSDVVEIAFTPGACSQGNIPEAILRILPSEQDKASGEIRAVLMPTKQAVPWSAWDDLASE